MELTSLNGAGLLGEDGFVTLADGRRLRTMVAGQGQDLVILESGLGASGFYWGPTQALLAKHTRVLAYERAGYGASDPATGRRDLTALAEDLHALVKSTNYRRLVLVGHSWGGPIVRLAAERLSEEGRAPQGLVLVDQSDEHAADLYLGKLARFNSQLQLKMMVPLAKLGLLKSLTSTMMKGLPGPIREAAVRAASSVPAAEAITAESKEVAAGIKLVQTQPPQLGDISVAVLSGVGGKRLEARLRTDLIEAHRVTAQEHSGARWVPAQHSGHLIPLTEPELIAEETLRTLH